MSTRENPTRREFLSQLSAIGVMLPGAGYLAIPALRRATYPGNVGISAQEALPTRAIPASGERLPVVGFGSSKAVLDIPSSGTDPIEAVINTMVEMGARVIDTSPRNEEIDTQFGRILGLPDFSDRLFVAAKINTEGGQAGIDQFRHTQRLFGKPVVDLVQVESLRDVETHWPNLRAWKDAGEVRYIGVTVSSSSAHERLENFMRREPLDFVHMNYSVVETAAEERLLPLAQERGMAVLTNRPFMNGSYFQRVEGHELPAWADEFDCHTWAQFSLKYILANPAVTCALTETTNPDHMRENIQAALGRSPDDATRRRMRALMLTF